MRLLAVSGSLRRDSHNTRLLRAAAQQLPPGVELEIYDGLKRIPPFDEDDEAMVASEVLRWREAIDAADAVLFATPEYNSSIPGQLKNAVDWASRPASDIPLVFGDLPVALIGAGGGAGTRVAQNAWLPVFRFLRMRPWFGQSLYVDRAHERFDEHNRLTDEATREQLAAVVTGFAAHCAELPRVRAS